jgi:hypothetical protein
MTDKINVYINTKNRNDYETSSKFIVNVPQNLLRLEKDEYFTLNVNGFYCFNTWFNCIDKFNNQFEIIIKNIDGDIVSKNSYELYAGNPNVNDVKNNLNTILASFITTTYDRTRNKFNFKRVLPVSNLNYSMYLNIINAEDFLGFRIKDRNKLIELPFNVEIPSNYVVNVLGDECIIIKIAGDVILSGSTIDNFGYTKYQPSNIIFIKPIDVPSNGLLKYDNEDGGDSFQYLLNNVEQISFFELSVYNQDDEPIPDFGEYILSLQFVKHKRKTNLEYLIETLVDYTKQIYLLISQIIFPR